MCKVTETYCAPPLSPCDNAKPLVCVTTRTMKDCQIDTPNRKRRVRFGANVEHVFEKDFTEADCPAIWYNGEEFAAIKSEIFAMMRSFQFGCGDDDGWHWRGFEHVQQKRPRKQIRRKHVEDLLYFQSVMNITDPDNLGLLANSNSRDSFQRARELGILDENEAMAIYNEKELEMEDEDTAPDVESISDSESTSSDEEDEPYQEPPLSFNINSCESPAEGDDKSARLLPAIPAPLPGQDEIVLSLLYVPYQVARYVFPCIR